MGSRIDRESKTVRKMIALYCRNNHGNKTLCRECTDIADYTSLRLNKCPFGEGKTTCVKCPVHCFQPEKRERIRQIMRYSGPRMMRYHPIAAVQHLIDDRREKPLKAKKNLG